MTLAPQDAERFERKMRPVPLPETVLHADHETGTDRIASALAAYWQGRYSACRTLEDRVLEEDLIEKFAPRWATETPFIMRALQNLVANCRDFDDYRQQLFTELESMRYHGPGA